MGLMLETGNNHLPCHRFSPGKKLEARISHIADAGRLGIAFTTGILVGIGESEEDRRQALQIIKKLNDRYGHIQEIIIQNFSPKSGTSMQDHSPPGFSDMKEAVRYAREIMPSMNIQVPPNIFPSFCELLDFGANDLGGISPDTDYINPEYKWQNVDELSDVLKIRGFYLQERLPVYPEINADISFAADNLRRELVGDVVTYVVNRNINFTNVCSGSCAFCAFSRKESDTDAYLMELPEISAKIEDAVFKGATEVCIQGGLHPWLEFDYYTRMLTAIKNRWPGIHIHAFSPMEVWKMAQTSGLPISEVLIRLKTSGLNSMPGTAAEILVDDIRQKICPDKLTTREWVEVITCAHKLGIRTSATMMFGHIETWEDRIKHLEIILRIQQETGGFTEFVLLPFLKKNTKLSARYNIKALPLEDILKVTAYARLFLGKELPNIQSSWPKIGLEGVIKSLSWGANDFGGTLMDENISRCAGSDHGQFLSQEVIEEAIHRAGRIPAERDTLYKILSTQGEHTDVIGADGIQGQLKRLSAN
jgi:7,8-didemethyl-8-hydroxy-5-deazariboflavin synthase CofH subunit